MLNIKLSRTLIDEDAHTGSSCKRDNKEVMATKSVYSKTGHIWTLDCYVLVFCSGKQGLKGKKKIKVGYLGARVYASNFTPLTPFFNLKHVWHYGTPARWQSG